MAIENKDNKLSEIQKRTMELVPIINQLTIEDVMSRIDYFIKIDKSNQSVVKLSTFKRTLNQLFNSYEN